MCCFARLGSPASGTACRVGKGDGTPVHVAKASRTPCPRALASFAPVPDARGHGAAFVPLETHARLARAFAHRTARGRRIMSWSSLFASGSDRKRAPPRAVARLFDALTDPRR